MVGVIKQSYQGFVLGKPLQVRIVILVPMENNQLQWTVEISARELRGQRSADDIIKYQCTFAKRCTKAIRALTLRFRLMYAPIRSSLCGQSCHRSSMLRVAQQVFLIIAGIIIAQLWDVVRRMMLLKHTRRLPSRTPQALSSVLQSPCRHTGLLHCTATWQSPGQTHQHCTLIQRLITLWHPSALFVCLPVSKFFKPMM
ncbi:hypothetical protein XU18_4525 [Perkinsela sp. CCAP 1560/4]|nr:hypothetical protein XU18_4525 [Perkinsela sp. CCAP 1560/4]|eukprot:KNH04171.1 hypothetical protein XU18_4525 [Perkinsela sp. CCAP 1560/4]